MSKFFIPFIFLPNLLYSAQIPSTYNNSKALLHMNERIGDTAKDTSDNNDASIIGSTHVTGYLDYGTDRTATQHGLYIPYNVNMDIGGTKDATFGVWYYIRTIPGHPRGYITGRAIGIERGSRVWLAGISYLRRSVRKVLGLLHHRTDEVTILIIYFNDVFITLVRACPPSVRDPDNPGDRLHPCSRRWYRGNFSVFADK